jgi:hypothetical protein
LCAFVDDKPSTDCVFCDRNFEAGADAMLKALRNMGVHVDRPASFSSLAEHTTLSNYENTGTYTFISDDEVTDD